MTVIRPVKLKDVIENLDMADDNSRAYYSKKTGKVLVASLEVFQGDHNRQEELLVCRN